MGQMKVGTCCYCGAKAAMVIGKESHSLQCSACGAPLSKLKMLRDGAGGATARSATPARPAPKKRDPNDRMESHRRSKKRKKNRSLKKRFLSEVWDVIEDIID